MCGPVVYLICYAHNQGRREVKKSPVQVTICPSPLHPQLGFPKSILALQYRATCFHGASSGHGPGTVYRLCTPPLSVALLTIMKRYA